MTVAIGVTERPALAGTLYNTLLYFGPDGMILGRHRISCTGHEHVVSGMGSGTTLRTIETPQAVHRRIDLLGELYAAQAAYSAVYAR